ARRASARGAWTRVDRDAGRGAARDARLGRARPARRAREPDAAGRVRRGAQPARGGIAMAQGEIVRPADLGLAEEDLAPLRRAAPASLRREGNTAAVRAQLAALIARDGFADAHADDEALAMIRGEMRRFADAEIAPAAQGWHRNDELIPLDVVA